MFLIETIQTAMSGADLYYRFAAGFGDMNRLANPYISAFEVPLIGAVVSLVVQYFFSYRVWVLSNKKSWWTCMAICAVSRAWCPNLQRYMNLTRSQFSTFGAVPAFAWGVYVSFCGFRITRLDLRYQAHVIDKFVSGWRLKFFALVGLPCF